MVWLGRTGARTASDPCVASASTWRSHETEHTSNPHHARRQPGATRRLIPFLRAKERGQPYDRDDFARLAREAVIDLVRKQVEAGIDVPHRRRAGQAELLRIRHRAIQRLRAQAGPAGAGRHATGDRPRVPGVPGLLRLVRDASRNGRADAGGDRKDGVDTCTGPISYKGHALVKAEIENLKAALEGLPHEDVFLPAIAPSYIAATLPNEHYRTETSTSRPSPTRSARSTRPSWTPASSFRSTIRAWSRTT